LWVRDAVPYNRVVVEHSGAAGGRAEAILVCGVERCADAGGREWFAAELAAAAASANAERFFAAYAGAGRRLRGIEARWESGEVAELGAAGLRTAESWTLDCVARVALLSRACRTAGLDAAAVVEHVYRTGDNAERVALLRALPVLAGAERFVDTAVGACRTHVTPVFEAIACENPYPAARFSDPAFNQMVVKAMFLALPVTRIEGLRARCNPELVRMARAYASERRAAGRDVTADVDLIVSLGAHPS
jgi:hypothetical protein